MASRTRDHARPEKADPTAMLTATPGNEIISDEVSYQAGASGEVTASPAILARRSASAGLLNHMSIIQGGLFTGTDDIDLPGATDGTYMSALRRSPCALSERGYRGEGDFAAVCGP